MRLARSIRDHRLAGSGRCRHHRILGRHHRRLVHVDVCAAEAAAQLIAPGVLELRTELRERVDMRIEPPPADHVAARRWNTRAPEPGEQRPREQERGANPAREPRVHFMRDVLRVDADLVLTGPFGLGAQTREQIDHRVDVPDAGHVGERHRLVCEQARREDRQRTVLVAGRADAPGDRVAPFDDE